MSHTFILMYNSFCRSRAIGYCGSDKSTRWITLYLYLFHTFALISHCEVTNVLLILTEDALSQVFSLMYLCIYYTSYLSYHSSSS